jgi:hypothetical protein
VYTKPEAGNSIETSAPIILGQPKMNLTLFVVLVVASHVVLNAAPQTSSSPAPVGVADLSCNAVTQDIGKFAGKQVTWIGRAVSWDSSTDAKGNEKKRTVYVITVNGTIPSPICSFVTMMARRLKTSPLPKQSIRAAIQAFEK